MKFYEVCQREGALGDPAICIETLRRILKAENLYNTRDIKARKKAILLAIIDDHSRMIVGYRFGFLENTRILEQVFKEAIVGYGLP